jgi:tetratricopeptide (TPR) repeat protein
MTAVVTPRAAQGADRRWMIVRSPSLTVVGDVSGDTLRDVAGQLEQFRLVVGGLIQNALRPLPVPTVVYVLDSRRALQPFLRTYNGHPSSTVGFSHYDPDVNYVVLTLEGSAESMHVIFHEYTHLLVNNAARDVPLWLNEGLAEYYGAYTLRPDGEAAEIGQVVRSYLLQLRERFMPVSDLIGVKSSAEIAGDSRRRAVFYAESWALVHYLITQLPDGGTRLNRYATAVAEGEAPDAAFGDSFGASPELIERAVRDYIRRPALQATRFTFREHLAAGRPSPARVISTAEANARLGDLQRRIGRVDEAAARIEGAVRDDPQSAYAQLSMALLRLTQRKPAEAWPALDRAAALAPDDFLVQYLYGVALLRDGDTPGGADDTRVKARSALKAAVALNATSAGALAWLAYADMQRAEDLPEAEVTIARAVALAPGHLEYRLRLADVLMLQDRLDEARAILTALAGVRNDRAVAEGATRRLAILARRLN